MDFEDRVNSNPIQDDQKVWNGVFQASLPIKPKERQHALDGDIRPLEECRRHCSKEAAQTEPLKEMPCTAANATRRRSERSERRRAELGTWPQSHHNTDSKTITQQANQPPENGQKSIRTQTQTVQNIDKTKCNKRGGVTLKSKTHCR